MDRNESKALIEEIEGLIEEGHNEEALDILDATNWRKVHNVNMLVTISSLYDKLDKDEDAKELLLIAHERSPIGRIILYHLALTCIKRKELNEAEKYYEEFVEIAPHDSMKYIIKYNLSKARGADVYTLIGILEDMKEFDFQEDWAFELAYLYHKSSQPEKCIALCDEIALWFGDGPYVEKALELKMMYQPLDKNQEGIYKSLRNTRDDITEIKANEMLESGEIISHDIEIPSVKMDPDRFNTINLQAEIKKNIEEIMAATEADEVEDKMENIKELVEEIPYLQIPDTEAENQKKQEKESKEIDERLKSKFKNLLHDDDDGQISLLVPEDKPKEEEEQVEGQMTIDDVMKEWDKKQQAAKEALEEANKQKFENAREKAISEANQILNKLVDVIPRLDAGESLQEISREANMPQDNPTYSVPKFDSQGETCGVGVEIPIVDVKTEHVMGETEKSSKNADDAKLWTPPRLTPEEIANSKILKNEDEPLDEIESAEDASFKMDKQDEKAIENEEVTEEVSYEEANKIFEDMNNFLQKQIDDIYEEEKKRSVKVNQEDNTEPEETIEPKDNLKNAPTFLDAEPIIDLDNCLEEDVEPLADMDVPTGATIRLPKINVSAQEDLPVIAEEEIKREALVENLTNEQITSDLEEEIEELRLTHEEKVQFSYFIPVSGMEERICSTLAGATAHLMDSDSNKGHIVIEGIEGSGKTMMATNLIKVLQNRVDKPGANVGKIDGDRLNDKDINDLFDKIKGGALIIERAGLMNMDTVVTLNLLLDNDKDNTLLLIEDTTEGINKLFNSYPELRKKFTEKLSIPIFTIDELVIFAKAYVKDWDCVFDELGVLALYNRINVSQSQGKVLSLSDVRDILDAAIQKADKGGILSLLGAKKYDDEGNLVLHEKDFSI